VNNPLVYLFACSVKNRVAKRLRRLREPRYLAGAVVGLAYMYLVFLRPRGGHRGSRGYERLSSGVAAATPWLQAAGTLVLWLIVAARWVIPVSTQPLQMTGAESHLLLTAPVSRRSIVCYKLLRAQTGILLSSALLLVFAWSAVTSAWSFVLGVFLLFTTVRLHLLGVALSRGSMFSRGGRDPIARLVLLFVLCASAAALWTLGSGAMAGLAAKQWNAAFVAARATASRPFAAAALLPFAALVRPLFAPWPWDFLWAVIPAVALASLNFAWVLQAEQGYQKAAGELEQVKAEQQPRAVRPVNRATPFRLAAQGPPELAIVWKNLIMFSRYASVALFIRLALLALVLAVAIGARGARVAAAFVPAVAVFAAMFALIGPYSIRNDLRQDLLQLSLIKTWPVSGDRVLWGEVLSPAIVVTAIDWLLICLALAMSLSIPPSALPWRDRISFAAAAAILAPSVVLAQTIVQNTAVVMFPGWVTVGPRQPRGIEAMGQQMLLMGATLLLLVVGLIPGVLIGGGLVLLLRGWIGWSSLIAGAAVVSALLIAEGWLAIYFLGRLLDRADPAAVDAGN
jgi:ABC-2 type transport system permease protein